MKTMEFFSGSMLHGFQGNPWNFPYAFSMVFPWFSHGFNTRVGNPMGTNCAPLLADLFLYSYENEFLDKLIKEDKRKLARKFKLSYC